MRRICEPSAASRALRFWDNGVCGCCLGGDIGTEDFRIGAAQVVAVEQRQIDGGAGDEARLAETERVGGEWRRRSDQLRSRPGTRPAGPRRFRRKRRRDRRTGSMAASSSGPARISIGCAPVRSSRRKTSPRCASRAPRARRICARELRAARWRPRGFRAPSARPFTALRPTRDAGKAAGPVHDHDAVRLLEFEACGMQQIGDGGDQRRRVGAPSKLGLPENLEVAAGNPPQRY